MSLLARWAGRGVGGEDSSAGRRGAADDRRRHVAWRTARGRTGGPCVRRVGDVMDDVCFQLTVTVI